MMLIKGLQVLSSGIWSQAFVNPKKPLFQQFLVSTWSQAKHYICMAYFCTFQRACTFIILFYPYKILMYLLTDFLSAFNHWGITKVKEWIQEGHRTSIKIIKWRTAKCASPSKG